MADSDASPVPHKKVKLSDTSSTSRKTHANTARSLQMSKKQSAVTTMSGQRETKYNPKDANEEAQMVCCPAHSLVCSRGTVLTSRQDIKNDAESTTASAQVWNTTELLEHIISYLPGKSVFVVSGVNKMSYNCVTNSSIAQSKLFLRPSGREKDVWLYCEFYSPPRRRRLQIGKPIVAQSFERSVDAYHEIKRTAQGDGMAKSGCQSSPYVLCLNWKTPRNRLHWAG